MPDANPALPLAPRKDALRESDAIQCSVSLGMGLVDAHHFSVPAHQKSFRLHQIVFRPPMRRIQGRVLSVHERRLPGLAQDHEPHNRPALAPHERQGRPWRQPGLPDC